MNNLTDLVGDEIAVLEAPAVVLETPRVDTPVVDSENRTEELMRQHLLPGILVSYVGAGALAAYGALGSENHPVLYSLAGYIAGSVIIPLSYFGGLRFIDYITSE